MILDVSNLLRRKTADLPFEIKYEEPYVERESFKVKLKSPLTVNGNAVYDGEVINLKGRISALLEVTCSRCLDTFDYDANIEFDEIFAKFNEEADVYLFEGDNLELTDMVIDNLILHIPVKFLCSENCKGLCPECGSNLNKHQCNCNIEDIDSKFAVLKDLFKVD
jgi:uncharacterized protein